ncbi:ESPR domain-containing protein, partial [Snodgrassella sp. ESL0253]|uniref:ESPR domain-containing protein n=1 Tax=Snodgrassella sp. ESL0253 TaxID=2705031 RepID=UPI00158273F8
MNKIYKLIWNRKEQAYTVTSELVRKRGKVTGTKLAVAIGAAMLSSNMAYAECSSCIESSAIFESQVIPAAIITLADETGNGSDETGNGSDETGNGSDETGNGSDETGNGSDETGNGSDETGNGS